MDGSAGNGGDSGLIASDGGDGAIEAASDAIGNAPGTASDGGGDATVIQSDTSDATASDASDDALGITSDASDASADGSACPSAPQLFPPQPGDGIACPFSATTDAGAQTCATGSQMCCVSPSSNAGPSSCQPFGDSCPEPASNFSVWQCSAPRDCVGAPVDGGDEPLVCCLVSGYAATTNAPGCPTTYKTVGGFDRMTCTAPSQCAGTEQVPDPGTDGGVFTDYLTVVCEADADCVAAGEGSTCTPIRVSGVNVGVCSLNLR